ncbi:Mitogen-activated protein kinase kinase kinase 1-like protein [Melia azedarach]|uniref:Mitogen-activated protein kinase kinase kinase 1-like protein n=1 Tax=Melia azedarach TaxID=155640 RepID=A0ACC1X9Y6_MELAZ|nr:Mitogen-activated protein kinase kinase kinase 1-like protein [Melia azedarach]
MESFASNSTPPDHYNHRRVRLTQPVTDRIARALRHQLRLLHRSDSLFFVLGATGNVYTVNLSSSPSCTCPDRITPCKHILFVFIRVLGVSPDDTCLRRRTLRPCQLSRLLSSPTLAEAMAGASLRERFHQLFFRARNNNNGSAGPVVEIEDGRACPICLDEMGKEDRLVACGTCKNLIHEECWVGWKRSRGRRAASCVICRARWRDRSDQEKYLNLAAFVNQEDDHHTAENSGGRLCGG